MKDEEAKKITCENEAPDKDPEVQDILEEIEIEDLAVDGICGVY